MAEEIKDIIEPVITIERLNGSQVAKAIDTYDNSQYVTNAAYFQGENPPVLAKDYGTTPNNKVPLPFGRRTVLDIMGYAYKPGYVNYVFDTEETNIEAQVEKIQEILDENKENLVSSEIFQDALIKGEGAELIYLRGTLAESNPGFVKIPREQVIFIYEDDVEEKLKYSIRYYTSTIIKPDGEAVKIKHADVYYPDIIQFFEFKEDSTESVNPQDNTQMNTVNKTNHYNPVGEEIHFFGDVPLYPYEINSDKLGVFQPAIRMIDAMDDMSSDSILNALGRFNDSILALSKKLSDEVIDNIKKYRIMDDMGGREEGNFVEYIQRQMDLNSTIEGFKTYERLYYELTGIPNLSDEKFHAQSGIALLYALIPFENLVSTMQVYFEGGLQYRLTLLNNLYGYDVKANMEWIRNLPEDTLAKITEIVTLKKEGLISTETALNRLPMGMIDDVEEEILKIDGEAEKNMALFEGQLDEPTDETNDAPGKPKGEDPFKKKAKDKEK